MDTPKKFYYLDTYYLKQHGVIKFLSYTNKPGCFIKLPLLDAKYTDPELSFNVSRLCVQCFLLETKEDHAHSCYMKINGPLHCKKNYRNDIIIDEILLQKVNKNYVCSSCNTTLFQQINNATCIT